jgi:hypothetical protein
MTTAEFEAHLKTAPCGAWITYHLGHLWWERDKDRELAALGDRVFKAYQSKAALLIQRRLGPGRFEYIAVKRSPSPPPPLPAKSNAPAASCGRFSPILKRIVSCTTDKT